MTDKRRDDTDGNANRNPDRMAASDRQRDERDDLARRRELMRQAQLTNREREERWPIG